MSEYGNVITVTYVIMRIMLWVATALALIFPFLYHFYSRGAWAPTPIGRHIMQFRATIALALLLTAASPFMPLEVALTAAVVLYGGIIAVLITQIKFILNPEAMDPQDILSDEPLPPTKVHSLILQQEPTVKKSRPVVITMSILAALQFLFGGLTALNLPDGSYNSTVLTIGAFGTLAVAASQVGIQFYVQNLVTPQVDVAAYRDDTGNIVAGPAAPPEGAPVDVVDEDTDRLH
jgi:small basic protein